MTLVRVLEIENFRAIKKLRRLPGPGMNCLIGPGDSGKSTILDAIDLCLGARRSLTFTDADFHAIDFDQPIRGDSTDPRGQRRFARQVDGAVTVEAVDLRDLTDFGAALDINGIQALTVVADFAENLMSNFSAADLVRTTASARAGTLGRALSDMEQAAVADMLFSAAPHLWGRTPEEARDTMELAQQVVSLPHGTKRDLLALVKKMVALERAADGAAAGTQRADEAGS